MGVCKARRKAIDVIAIHYTENTNEIELVNMMKESSSEPVRLDKKSRTIYIQKDRGEIALILGNWLLYEYNTDHQFWAIDHDIFLQSYDKVDGTLYQFRKKEYVVDCIQFDSLTKECVKEIVTFANLSLTDAKIDSCLKQEYIMIDTLEGLEELRVGEWLIKGIKGELYPVSEDSFHQVYYLIRR